MMPDELRQEIELQIVELLKNKLSEGQLTEERSKEIAKWVLEVLKPGSSFQELYKGIEKLDDNFPEMSEIVVPLLREYEERVMKKALQTIQEYIKVGQYDAACTLAKKTSTRDVKLRWGKG